MTEAKQMSKRDELAARMLSFEGDFDGYPGLSCTDMGLIGAASAEGDSDAVVLMSYIASELVTTREQYKSAKAYIQSYMEDCWYANFCEGDNALYSEMTENGEV